MSNYFNSLIRAAACPRTTVPAPRVLAPLSPAAVAADVAPGHVSTELGRVWAAGIDKRVELHVFATSAVVQVDAQIEDTGNRMSLGPPPWRPPERKL